MRLRSGFITALFLLSSLALKAQLRLPAIVRDSMVLQRDSHVKLWGWARPGEKVTINLAGNTTSARTGPDGKWDATLPPMKAGGPYTMTVRGKKSIRINNVLVGDVWLCAGQSNMVHQMKLHSVRYAKEVATADFPDIRQFWVPTLTNLQGPQDHLPTCYWSPADSSGIADFSAVAYFFAKKLYQKYHIPIGIINTSVGGTPIEAWTSEEGLKSFPDILKRIRRNQDTALMGSMRKRRSMMPRPKMPEDKGLSGAVAWYDPSYVPKEWRRIGIPGYWEDQGVRDLNGSVWYRKEIDVPASMAGKPARVFLGRIVDADFLYINGKLVGHTTYQYPERRYHVPAGVLKAGKNLFVIRVINYAGKGGFVPDKPYLLFSGNDTVDLKGYWQYKVGEVFIPHGRRFGGGGFAPQNQPTALYNAMVAPIVGYSIKGMVWYQGASNTWEAGKYAGLQTALIRDWRSKWKEGQIPFLYVQLPGFGDYDYLPTESQWALLREGQLKALALPNTAMAVTIDLGEWNDIHPDRKEPVGDRLALAAEKLAYGQDIVYSGPIYESAARRGDSIIVSFTHTGSGLVTDDGEAPQEFAIAGADKKFVWAKTKIEGNKVVVWNDDVKDPKYVRYAWADDPVNPNLYNKEGLPASPFRTDK
jgi:sialate O-acetylesterase